MKLIPTIVAVLFAAPMSAVAFDSPVNADASTYLPEYNRVIRTDDFILIRGRLRECLAWDGRVVQMSKVPSNGAVDLLGLGEIHVEGLTAGAALADLRRQFANRLAVDDPPFITIEIIPAGQLDGGTTALYANSVKAMGTDVCVKSSGPGWWPRKTQHEPPPRAIPETEDDLELVPPTNTPEFYKGLA